MTESQINYKTIRTMHLSCFILNKCVLDFFFGFNIPFTFIIAGTKLPIFKLAIARLQFTIHLYFFNFRSKYSLYLHHFMLFSANLINIFRMQQSSRLLCRHKARILKSIRNNGIDETSLISGVAPDVNPKGMDYGVNVNYDQFGICPSNNAIYCRVALYGTGSVVYRSELVNRGRKQNCQRSRK